MSERERLSEEYDCDVVGCRVRVDVLKVTLRGAPGGAGPVPFGTAFRMKGCDGNAECHIFSGPWAFESPLPTRCPYHANLNRGGSRKPSL